MTPLTERERELLGISLSIYGNVQTIRGRVEELLDLATKLGVRPDLLSKSLRMAMNARLKRAGADVRTTGEQP